MILLAPTQDFQTEVCIVQNKSLVYLLGEKRNYRRNLLLTLESGIDVDPTVINLAFFSRPYGLIKGPTFINFWNFF